MGLKRCLNRGELHLVFCRVARISPPSRRQRSYTIVVVVVVLAIQSRYLIFRLSTRPAHARSLSPSFIWTGRRADGHTPASRLQYR